MYRENRPIIVINEHKYNNGVDQNFMDQQRDLVNQQQNTAMAQAQMMNMMWRQNMIAMQNMSGGNFLGPPQNYNMAPELEGPKDEKYINRVDDNVEIEKKGPDIQDAEYEIIEERGYDLTMEKEKIRIDNVHVVKNKHSGHPTIQIEMGWDPKIWFEIARQIIEKVIVGEKIDSDDVTACIDLIDTDGNKHRTIYSPKPTISRKFKCHGYGERNRSVMLSYNSKNFSNLTHVFESMWISGVPIYYIEEEDCNKLFMDLPISEYRPFLSLFPGKKNLISNQPRNAFLLKKGKTKDNKEGWLLKSV